MGKSTVGSERASRDSACLDTFGNIAAHWNMSTSEQCLLLGLEDEEVLRDWMDKRRQMRDLATTDADKAAAFVPTYQDTPGARARFRRSEVEEWQRSYAR